MALKDKWVDKVNGVDIASADDINQVANAVIELENEAESGGGKGEDGISPIVSVTEIEGGHRITVTDAEGDKTFDVKDGTNGQDGQDGVDGKDGTSVTVESVTESAEDGGENVVTFSDGKTLTVKNGRAGTDGKNGKDGADGKDYVLTEADRTEIAEEAAALVDTSGFVAKNQGAANVGKILVVGTDGNFTLIDMPDGGASGDVVGTLDESNNILLSGNLASGTYTLKYENADGTYSEIGTLVVAEAPEAEEIINQIPISIDSKGEVYNGTGYKQNVRLKSDGVTEDTVSANTDLTGYIPAVPGDIIRFKNMVLTPTETTGGQYLTMLRLYDSSFAMLKAYSYGNTWNPIEDGDVYTYTVTNDYPDAAYIRVQAQTIDSTSIITVNQEIV